MKNIIFTTALAIAAAFGSFAFADAQPGNCQLNFNVQINSFLVFSNGGGTGVVTCWNASGSHTSNVNIDIEGIGLGLGTFSVQGVAGNLGIVDAEKLVGTYAVVEANVGVGGAVGASLGFEGQQNGLSFTGNVAAGQGIGVMLNGTQWTIKLAQ